MLTHGRFAIRSAGLGTVAWNLRVRRAKERAPHHLMAGALSNSLCETDLAVLEPVERLANQNVD